jgi:ABC-type multidrug transport system fused ATPase/permease subunit
VADNLRLGKEDATDEELRAALEAACAWSFVSKLPLGVNTPIGEGGKGLSEGQAQRISIARALIRNAPILLLDEVTSALDKTTEQKVLKNLTAKGVTTLLTTHRMTMLDRCARIYRVENGQVCEETQY